MSRIAHVLGVILAIVTMGCAAARPVAMSSDEWLAYRRTRTSPTLEGRIIAAARYLARYPQGSFVSTTDQFFRQAEPLYFEQQRKEPGGLYTYLAALPRGPHADEARQLIYFRKNKPRGPKGFEANLMALDARVTKQAAERAAARQEFIKALQMWMDPEAFVRPIAEAKPELVIPWSLSLPTARCQRVDPTTSTVIRECTKLLEPLYEATNGEEWEERQATIEVVVSQDASGRPIKAVIGGPDLFTRLEETFGGRTIAPADTSARAASVSRITEIVRREFSILVSDDPACRQRAKSPAVMAFGCQSMRVVVEAALDGASDDRVVIERVQGK